MKISVFNNRGRDVLKDILEDIVEKGGKKEELRSGASSSSASPSNVRIVDGNRVVKDINASDALNKLIYMRHALYHGVEELYEMTESDLEPRVFFFFWSPHPEKDQVPMRTTWNLQLPPCS